MYQGGDVALQAVWVGSIPTESTLQKRVKVMSMKRATLDTRKLGLNLGVITVEVVGEATEKFPILGQILIVKSPEIKSDYYPYECFSCPETYLNFVE